ncbi:peptidase [Bacillus canaveralius]|uniref:Peptidase n=1 Tax=Bacillus canaveralius TaxID=1403243 RepID=A0A2N5GPQ5_9BACI|nr:S9 family peptidase [Bacillus canaveralius]PLR84679.1 peptidase [Bacillus canaveralius]PLR88005.1 peptidase [Bacillus canaveralius]RSK53310.1 S9 family peptidase [Bacillus canaveralius]
MTTKRTITAEDLYTLKSATDPRLAPNGRDLLYVETAMLKEKNDYSAHLFYINLDEKAKPVQWTYGEHRNHSPRWSPDGSRVAFISNRTGKNQIYILNAGGGEAKQVTFSRNGAGSPVWSPDGTKIAFSISLGKDDSVSDRDGEQEKKQELVPLEVDKMKYKSDAQGFLNGKVAQVAVVDLNSGEITQITDGKTDYHLQSWSPDGGKIAVTADLSDDTDSTFLNDVYLIDVKADNKLQRVTDGTGYFGSVTWSPDGKHLGLFGHGREYENATLTKLWVYDISSGTLKCLTNNWDVQAGDTVVGDFQQGAVTPGMLWADDNESFYFVATDHGNTVVYYGNLKGEIYPALLDNQHVYGLAADGRNERAVVAISKADQPGDLYTLNISTGALEQLTNVNADFLKEVTLSQPQAINLSAKDGTELHGWIMKPANYEEGKKYPLILEIHGGPHAMYANTFFHEFQLLAAEGYAVLYINPRGSLGYGQEFVNAVRGDYGGEDYKDLMAAVDYAIDSFPFVDKERLGVMGGSYGGFMTNWIVGQTDRFKAAITLRSISNWVSFYGVSDIGYYFTEWQINADLNDIETLWKHSPLAYAGNIKTPLLIMHGEKDYRCPVEQAEQLFIALKRQGKETKFIRFPESNHELSRSGKPQLRIQRLNYITEWFKDHI